MDDAAVVLIIPVHAEYLVDNFWLIGKIVVLNESHDCLQFVLAVDHSLLH